MSQLQNEHVAWQRSMLDGRLQELRAAAAQVENNQALQVTAQPSFNCTDMSAFLDPCWEREGGKEKLFISQLQ